MVAGIEFGKEYAQICVKTEAMKESESFGIFSEEEPEALFRKLLKLIKPYGNPEKLEFLVFVLEENTESRRQLLRDMAQRYQITPERVCFLDQKESFCTYVFHQQGDLLAHNALLIANSREGQSMLLLHRRMGTVPAAAEVRDVSGEPLETLLSNHAVSSVFLVGDFETEWQERYLKLLKRGRRVFAGKNLYVKGACFRAMELSEGGNRGYLYLGEETLRCNIALKGENQTVISVAEAGKNWYESDCELEMLLMEGRELEFLLCPMEGQEKTVITVPLEGLPERPPKATRLHLALRFTDAEHTRYRVRDLGFGEIFPPSDIVYEGELQWEQ